MSVNISTSSTLVDVHILNGVSITSDVTLNYTKLRQSHETGLIDCLTLSQYHTVTKF